MNELPIFLPPNTSRMADRLTDVTSWHGLIPIAFAIVALHRPKLLVELGTHFGDSYCAFCQAVQTEGFDTRCFAVDTWTGDEQSGKYGPEVLRDLKAYHDSRYGSFSTLIQNTFDGAVANFADGSIDLLHIDGLHTYEAVKHDFTTWLPKLSDRALVLFHDIEVRQLDFGVWRFWNELQKQYPCLQFRFSNGLGVMAAGQVTGGIKTWFDLPGSQVRALHDMLETLGRRISLEAEVHRAKSQISELDQALRSEQGKSHSEWTQRVDKEKEVAHAQLQLAELRRSLDRALADHVDLENRLKQAQALAESYRAEHQQLQAEHQQLQAQHEQLQARAEFYRSEHQQAITSRSWRLTTPLRAASALLQKRNQPTELGPDVVPRTAFTPHPTEDTPCQQFDVPAGQDAWNLYGEQRLHELIRQDRQLEFRTAENPLLSIIMVFYNKAHLSLLSLESVLAKADVNYELLIVDNASTDRTDELLRRLRNVRIIRNAINVGFGPACMQAAERARGEYLCFLNNDALLLEHGLSIPLENFRRSKVGAVGGKILLADGRLQEAGSIVWADASALGYGRAADPLASPYNFRRPVDYCSGAFLFTPRKLFSDLKGFSARYGPAYYEDTDYCLKVWNSGLEVIYEPRAVIRHYESASSGGNESAKSLMAANQTKFSKEWQHVLRYHLPPSPRNIVRARIAAMSRGLRILYLDDRIPHRDLGSGFPRSNELLRTLVGLGHHVACVALNFPIRGNGDEYRDVPIEVELVDGYRAYDSVLRDYVPAYDLIWISRPHNMERLLRDMATLVGFPAPKIVYDAEAIFSDRDRMKSELAGRQLSQNAVQAWAMREASLALAADVVVTVSERDAHHFASYGVERVCVVGHRLESAPTPSSYAERKVFLFVGAVHGQDNPNLDSLRYFCREIWPTVFKGTGADLLIAGYGTEEVAKEFRLPGVRVIGRQDDLQPIYDLARVFIVPTRYCAGIPYKAHEAASFGVPMVVSPIILQQLAWTAGQDCLVGGDVTSFANSCIRLYETEALWSSIRANALQRVHDELSSASFLRAVSSVLEQVPPSSHMLEGQGAQVYERVPSLATTAPAENSQGDIATSMR